MEFLALPLFSHMIRGQDICASVSSSVEWGYSRGHRDCRGGVWRQPLGKQKLVLISALEKDITISNTFKDTVKVLMQLLI